MDMAALMETRSLIFFFVTASDDRINKNWVNVVHRRNYGSNAGIHAWEEQSRILEDLKKGRKGFEFNV